MCPLLLLLLLLMYPLLLLLLMCPLLLLLLLCLLLLLLLLLGWPPSWKGEAEAVGGRDRDSSRRGSGRARGGHYEPSARWSRAGFDLTQDPVGWCKGWLG